MISGGKLLVVGPSWVGDMVMAQSLYRMLKAERGEAVEIHVLAPPWSLPVLARMPEVARGIELAVSHGKLNLGIRRELGRRLRPQRYAQAIVLPRSLKSALVPFFADIPVRTGFRGEWRFGLINDMRPFDSKQHDQTVRRFVALGMSSADDELAAILPPRLASDARVSAGLIKRLGLDTDQTVIALIPGAEYGPAKRWPLEYFVELATRLLAAGLAVWVLGSDKEEPIGSELVFRAGDTRIRNLCGASTLTEAIDLLALSTLAVSNDSGLMHIAAAVGTHVVAIYGSSSPRFTPPLTDSKTICHKDLSCSPCFERTCPLTHLHCLRKISVDSVFQAVSDVVDAAPANANGAPRA